jgi:hypothetical protein
MNTPLFKNETVQHLREDTTDSFQAVERALRDVENRTMDEIKKIKCPQPINQDRDPGFIIPKFIGNQGNIATFDGLGNLYDSYINVNDYSEPSPFVLYSSEKHNKDLRKTLETISNTLPNTKMDKVPGASLNSIASFDSRGQVKSSDISVNGFKQIAQSAEQSAFNASQYAKQANESISAANKILVNAEKIAQNGTTVSFSGTPGNVPIYNSSGIQDSKISSNSLMLKSIPKQNNSLAVLDINGEVKDSLYGINDSITSPNVLWTSSNIDSVFQKKIAGTPGNVPIYNSFGIQDSKISSDSLMLKSIPKQNNSLAVLDINGEVKDSLYGINDSITSPNVLWTSSNIDSVFQKKLPGNDTIALLSTSGDLKNSNIVIDDNNVSSPNVLWTSDKMASMFAEKIAQNGTTFSGTPGNVPIYNSSGIQDSEISSDSLMLKSIPKQNNSLAVLDSSGQIKDSLYGINDSITSPNVLWSSSNIDLVFQKKIAGTSGNVPIYNSSGIQDSKISSDSLMLKSIPKQNNSLAVLDSSGQIKDSLYGIDDSITSPNVLWTSSNIDSVFQKKLPGNDTIPLLSASGDLKNSNIVIDDNNVSSPNVLWTSGKMTSMFTGNGLAKMTTSGVLYDTGIDPSNLLTKIQNSTDGNLSALNSGTIYDSGYSIRDNLNPDKNIIWSSNKIDSNYIKKLSGNYTVPYISPDGQLIDSNQTMENFVKVTKPSESGNLPVLDKSGQLIDSNFRIDDSLNSLNTVWSSKKNDLTYIKLLPGTNLAQLGLDGQLIDSGISVNDFAQNLQKTITNDTEPPSSTNIWSSEKIINSFPLKITNSTNLAQLGLDGQLHDSGLSPTNVMQKIIPKENGSIAVLDASGQISDSGFSIDDTKSSSSNILWSTTKNNETFMKKLSGDSTVPLLTTNGQLIDSNVNLSNVMLKSIPTADQSVAILNSLGQTVDSGFSIDDTKSSSSNILWSTTKNNETFMKKLSGDSTVPLLTTNGQLIDSNVNLSNVMLKSIPTTDQSVAILNSLGQTVDSGFSIDDTKSSSSNILWSTKKIDDSYISKTAPIIQNSLLVKSPDGNLQENKIVIDDSKPASETVLWTSNKVQQIAITPPLPKTEGNILQYDNTGKLISAKPNNLMFASVPDGTWTTGHGPYMYMAVLILKSGSSYAVVIGSSINFNPAHTYVLSATALYAQQTNVPALPVHKKLNGTLVWYGAASLNICILGTPSAPWALYSDDKMEILFLDKTNKGLFKIICIINGLGVGKHVITIERLN